MSPTEFLAALVKNSRVSVAMFQQNRILRLSTIGLPGYFADFSKRGAKILGSDRRVIPAGTYVFEGFSKQQVGNRLAVRLHLTKLEPRTSTQKIEVSVAV